MPLRRFRRQYEQLLQFERWRIIGMMEAGWSARRPTASSAAIQAQVAPSLGAPVYSRALRRRLGGHYVCCLLTLPHRRLRLEWCRARGNWPAAEWNQHFSQLSEFERGLIIGMKTAGGLTRRVAGQVDRSECAVRNCWEQ
ncbi:transposable element Tcb2 transposase [Trichonephila clavipes]|uniref:Transposable element Tcb2 transposase n=1 Tax=Trichonephila clavipes TaxID=2585209 RepID=A0A8X6SA47_TRICX|nr:transposable element Tcb2 transposase [Trichonephila clavipes]